MTAPIASDVRTVTLVGLPVQLWLAAKEHSDELVREFTLIAERSEAAPGGADMPSRLVSLIAVLRQQYGGGSDEREQALFAAAASGVDTLDVQIELPVAAMGAIRTLSPMLDEADDYCREGKHLLTLATPPRIVAFRRWYLEQIATQLEGAAPVPWAGADAPG